jgi:hypothetical protein
MSQMLRCTMPHMYPRNENLWEPVFVFCFSHKMVGCFSFAVVIGVVSFEGMLSPHHNVFKQLVDFYLP